MRSIERSQAVTYTEKVVADIRNGARIETLLLQTAIKAKFHYASLFGAASELAPNRFGAC